MTTFSIYIFFIIIIALLLLSINFMFSTHNPYMEKKTAFECGFHSFLGQNRTQFTISFFIFALLFLLFDLVILLIFFVLLTAGLVFELGKKALTIYSKQSFYKT